MLRLFFDQALLPAGWARGVRMTLANGRIARLEIGAAPASSDEHHAIAIPGMPDLHSHAFQRGMAGLTERGSPAGDNFWTWREVMYRFALRVSPDDIEAIAAQLFTELLEAGFTRIGEFHYLHHDLDGTPYANLAETATRIAAAATETGIGLTLIPTFYAHGGLGGVPPSAHQRRFINDLDRFAKLFAASSAALAGLDDARIGLAAHSLRAARPEELAALIVIAGDHPIHLHIAEQVKEVEDCIHWSGARPVEWLLDHAPVDRRWCLVHATHMTPAESDRLARSGAVAGLCPITEADLGDGVFDAVTYVGAGGAFGIGTDSNVLLGVADELRQLEYSQRLVHRARNLMSRAEGGSTGRALFDAALTGGARALGVATAGLAEGAAADIVTLDHDHPALIDRAGDAILDAFIFGSGHSAIDCVWRYGKKVVSGGRHVARDRCRARFRAVMARLLA
ncbi:MAG TPA: formimidoylglutamate deiminase [Stellaceae bacterium]|nr:formimidoylglutamate deiminase [Stellaceae bacterium]